jgi:hypothetical protein
MLLNKRKFKLFGNWKSETTTNQFEQNMTKQTTSSASTDVSVSFSARRHCHRLHLIFQTNKISVNTKNRKQQTMRESCCCRSFNTNDG